jgi:thiol-disulfide isomerase/thioredoxin
LLPANAILSYSDNGQAIFEFKNGSELVSASEVDIIGDSVIIKMPYFNTSLHLLNESDDLLSGSFINHDKQNYLIPVQAEFNKEFRFTPSVSSQVIGDRYKVIFTQPSGETYNAILQIKNEQGHLTGTFRTETGDYRFLQGNIMNGKVNLSTFDGAHLFYFDAEIRGDSLTNGRFLSGNHYRSTWKAVTDTIFELQNPESITYLINTNDTIDFRLLNQDGDSVQWSDLNLDGKVVILDIMGSWCPNCLDANKALYSIIEKYPHGKVALIPISFEHASNFDLAKPLIERSLNKNDEHSTFLFGGKATKHQASSVFPMLNAISSFPTIIIIDRNRKVQLIYTGFNGPGTGIHYEQFIDRVDSLIRTLISD